MKLGITFFLMLLAADISHGATQFTTLLSFNWTNGAYPNCELIQGKDGKFYGTTSLGGVPNDGGTVFKMTKDGHLTTWVSFGDLTNGSSPEAGLTQDNAGNFYGTTFGDFANVAPFGAIFKITPSGQFTNLVLFNDTNGDGPNGLLLGIDGNFYGTTHGGGENEHFGTVFKLTVDGTLDTLFSFNNTNGSHPSAGLAQDSIGNLYGTTTDGGTNFTDTGGVGTVFKMTPDGTLVWSVSFNSSNGLFPNGALVEGADGNFYGTTTLGGLNLQSGTIFKITPDGELTTIYSFSLDHFGQNLDGLGPSGTLIRAAADAFYGTTPTGGTNGAGTIFKITTNGTLTTLYSFGTSVNAAGNPLDGDGSKQLMMGDDGNLYGTAYFGGVYDNIGNGGLGTVFRLSIIRPVINVIYPFQHGIVTKPTITVSGKTKGDVVDVFYQINGSDWARATTADNWSGWTANVTLLQGMNTLRAYAVDASGNPSLTNTVKFFLTKHGGGRH